MEGQADGSGLKKKGFQVLYLRPPLGLEKNAISCMAECCKGVAPNDHIQLLTAQT
jgi:hypothetical protein